MTDASVRSRCVRASGNASRFVVARRGVDNGEFRVGGEQRETLVDCPSVGGHEDIVGGGVDVEVIGVDVGAEHYSVIGDGVEVVVMEDLVVFDTDLGVVIVRVVGFGWKTERDVSVVRVVGVDGSEDVIGVGHGVFFPASGRGILCE